jgi:site-specific recombinase XerD
MSSTRRKAGLLGSQVEGYRAWLLRRGYTLQTVRNMLKDLGQLGLWSVAEGLELADLDEKRMVAFLAARRAAGHRRVLGPRAMVPLLSYLREAGVVVAATVSSTPLGELLEQYRSWMVQERNLALTTVLRYENTARRFLQEQASTGDVFAPADLTGADVNVFLLRECDRVSAGSGGRAPLDPAIPLFARRHASAPRDGRASRRRLALRHFAAHGDDSGDVQALLDSCDRGNPVGIRNFAIMMLVARLGLRSIEVARLELRDVDWRAGELVVRGKARRRDRLPLPAEVGDALVAYLSCGRNPQDARHLFLTCKAPRGPIRADLVGDVVERACERAGLPRVGPHRLRHALAGELLRQGAGLVAIGQVLRHQDLATTALYAKVDLGALRRVAQVWPGATR